MEDTHFTIVPETVGDLVAELIELFLALEEEAEGHARVKLAHVYRTSRECAVVILLLCGNICVRIHLWTYVVWIKEDQPVSLVLVFLLQQAIEFIV